MVLGSGFFMSFISLFLKKSGMGDIGIGLTQSFFYFGLLVSSLYSEKLISRVGHIRALTAACGMLIASTLVLFFLPPQYWVWLRLLAGMCVGCFYIGVESWLLAEFSQEKRGYALAIYTISLYLAQSMSQTFLQFTENSNTSAFIISAALVSLAVVPVSLGKGKGPAYGDSPRGSILKYFKISPLGILGCFFAGLILSSIYAFMPMFIADRGHNPGFLMTIMIFGGAALQWPIGKLSDKLDRRKVLIALAACAALSVLFLFMAKEFNTLAGSLFILGGLTFTIYPVAMALGCDCVTDSSLVKMTGMLLFSYGLGAVIGPSLTPLLKIVSPDYLAIMLVVYCIILLITGFYIQSVRPPVDESLRTEFTVIPNGPLIEDMHPVNLDVASSEETVSADDAQLVEMQSSQPH